MAENATSNTEELSFIDRQKAEIQNKLDEGLKKVNEENLEATDLSIEFSLESEINATVYEYFMMEGWKLTSIGQETKPDGKIILKVLAERTTLGQRMYINTVDIQRQFIEEQLKFKRENGNTSYIYVGMVYIANYVYFKAQGYRITEVISEALKAKYDGMPVMRFDIADSTQTKTDAQTKTES